MSRPAIAVLGGGPAGLGLSWRLVLQGFDVTLLEASPRTGGNSGSFEIEGHIVDYGSHRLHPSCPPEILSDIKAMLGPSLLDRPRHGRIHLMGRWLHFPLRAADIVLNAPPRFAAGAMRDAIVKPRGRQAEESFAAVLERGLGPTICREFYFPYARKIWGLEPGELDAEQARRRVSAGTIGKVLQKVIGKSGRKRFYYPRGGFGAISGAYATAAGKAGARILTSAAVTSIEIAGDRAVVRADGTGGAVSVECALVMSTIPVATAVSLIRPAAPAEVIEATQGLRYRAMVLVYLLLPVAQFTEFDAHYFPSREIAITRLSEPKNYGLSGPGGSTVLCAEIPCDAGDEVWSSSEAGLGRLVLDAMERAGIPWRGDVTRIEVRRLRQAYPVYARGFGERLSRVAGWLGGLHRFVTLGRQGLFVHDNTHHTLAMAYAAAKCVRPDAAFDRNAWSLHKRGFDAFTVED
jgi:protoporphyrinogen oxidase